MHLRASARPSSIRATSRTAPKSARFPRRRTRRGLWLGLLGLCAGLACSTDLRAADRPIALGAVGTRSSERSDLARALRSAVEEELARIDFGRHRPRERWVLSATLLELDSVTESDSVRATCVVSVALRRRRGSTLEAVIKGRATAEEARAAGESVRVTALRAAVHSAIRRVPETLSASER